MFWCAQENVVNKTTKTHASAVSSKAPLRLARSPADAVEHDTDTEIRYDD